MVRNQIELNSPKGCVQLIRTFCPMQISLAGFIFLYFAVLHLFYIKHNFPHYYSISFVVDTCTYKERRHSVEQIWQIPLNPQNLAKNLRNTRHFALPKETVIWNYAHAFEHFDEYWWWKQLIYYGIQEVTEFFSKTHELIDRVVEI